MSKLGCKCGHIITDQADNLAYKAEFVRNQDLPAYDVFLKDVSNFASSIENGTKKEWLQNYFGDNNYEKLDNYFIIQYIYAIKVVNMIGTVYLCENCGRVLIQKGNGNAFLPFSPDNSEWKDLFKGIV
jgi:hypothetical protein